MAEKSVLEYDHMAVSFISFSLCAFLSYLLSSWYVFKEGHESRKWAVASIKMYLAYRSTLSIHLCPRDISVCCVDTVARDLRAGKFHHEQVLGIQMSPSRGRPVIIVLKEQLKNDWLFS